MRDLAHDENLNPDNVTEKQLRDKNLDPTVIDEIVFPVTITVAAAPVPVPVPVVRDTLLYVASTQSVGLVVIEVNKASAVVNNLPGVVAVVIVNVKPVPPDGDTVVATSEKIPAVPPVPPDVKDASKLPPASGMPLSISLNTGELTAEVNDPDVTLVTSKELPPFWKYWFAAIEVR